MEFEERNPKPEESSKNLPLVVLFTLIGIVCLLLWVGWKYLSDEASTSKELSEVSIPVESTNTLNTENSTTVEPQVEEFTEPEKVEEPIKIEAASEKIVEKAVIEKVNIGNETYNYLVGEGETFLGIANRFNLSQDQLKSSNPGIEPSSIKVGVTKLKIPVQKIHTVGPGDILRVVAKKYDISVDEIMIANKKIKNFAERGEKLAIPLKK